MCGLFGFVSTGGFADGKFVDHLADRAAERGPDGWGISWSADGENFCDYAADGKYCGGADKVVAVARVVVGHCRLATSGDRAIRQPVACGKGRIAHNGNVANYRDLAAGLPAKMDLDSEVLGLLIDAGAGALAARVESALARAQPPSPSAVVAAWPRAVAVAETGQPLFLLTREEGVYFCSVDPGGGDRLVGSADWPVASASFPAPRGQPIADVAWLPRDWVKPNDYNPNKQAPPESRLLKVSILEDGWTQSIVVHRGSNVIVDGEHRWLAAADKDVAALTGGLVPVVFVDGDLSHRMMSTIRHNRARGEHGVLPMAEIVVALLSAGKDKDEVMFLLQMEAEEVERLADRAGMPAIVGREKPGFGRAWIPG